MNPVVLRPRRSAVRFVLLLLAGLATALLGACGSDAEVTGTDGPAPGRETAVIALATDATVIDVRTPEEFDAGHVEGATNIDVQGADFEDRIADLPRDVTYVVYCRSGNRSAAATERMLDAGITALDGGGLDDMLAGGYTQAP